MTTRIFNSVSCLAILLSSQAARTDVLHDHDNGPLTGFFGVPDSTEGSHLVAPQRFALDTVIVTSSHSVRDVEGDELLLLDGETTRLELRVRYGLGDRTEIGIELPYLWHESGGLDGLVDNWHNWFGFPGGFRATRPEDALEFRYVDLTGNQLNFSNNTNGPGDIRLFGGYRLKSSPGHSMALRFGYKFATGDSDELLGSGGNEISIGLVGDLTEFFGVSGLTAFYRISGVFIGEPDILSDRHQSFATHLAAGAGYQVADWLELRLQGALRGALYDSEIEVLGENYGAISFGANMRLTELWMMSLAIAEDVKVRSAPDVSFQLALRYSPR